MNPSCRVDGCADDVKVKVRQLCNRHYKQLQRTTGLPAVDRFGRRTAAHPSGCLLWTGRVDKGGYGRWGTRFAHRVAWERTHGPIPQGLTIDHLCRVHGCVNVEHLRLLPPHENFSDNGWRDREACIWGHAYDEANTRWRERHGRRTRVCRACERDRQAKSRRRR